MKILISTCDINIFICNREYWILFIFGYMWMYENDLMDLFLMWNHKKLYLILSISLKFIYSQHVTIKKMFWKFAYYMCTIMSFLHMTVNKITNVSYYVPFPSSFYILPNIWCKWNKIIKYYDILFYYSQS